MLNRREFIKIAITTGLMAGTGSILTSCAGIKRAELTVSGHQKK